MKKIAIHSVPRSGSTWLGEILNSSPDVKYCFQPLFSYQCKDFLNENSSKEDINKFFSLLSDTDDDYICQNTQRQEGTLPDFKKSNFATHVIYKEARYHHIIETLLREDDRIKLILLVRNPVEVMNSWINAPKEFDPTWDIETQLFNAEQKNLGRKENFYGLNAWIQTTKLFEDLSKRYNKRTLLINYSFLKNNLEHTVERIYQFCDLPLTDATYNFLKQSTKKTIPDPYSVFRDGKKSTITLSEQIINKITTHVSNAGLSTYINH